MCISDISYFETLRIPEEQEMPCVSIPGVQNKVPSSVKWLIVRMRQLKCECGEGQKVNSTEQLLSAALPAE